MADYNLAKLADLHLLYQEARPNRRKGTCIRKDFQGGGSHHVAVQRLYGLLHEKGFLDRGLVDLAVCKLYCLRKLCYSELRTTPAQ